MKKLMIIFSLALTFKMLQAIEKPNLHPSVSIDAKFYSGDNDNTGTYDTNNRFQVRKAALTIDGELQDRVDYVFEFGISTCVGSSTELKIMEAFLNYEAFENFHIGFGQAHVLRGFASSIECNNRLTIEKPDFIKTFSECHPQGAMFNYISELPFEMEIEAEVAFLNGSGGTLDGEHDYNYAFILDTPVEGFSFSASYNHTAKMYYEGVNNAKISKDGLRYNFGFQYDNYGLLVASEFFHGEGFDNSKREHDAYYAHLGYRFQINFDRLQSIQPYAEISSWDKDASGLDKETLGDQIFDELEVGLNLQLSKYTMLRIAYVNNIDQTEVNDNLKIPNSTVFRLQTSF